MNRTECKNQMINFRFAIDNYQRTILNSDYQLSPDAQKRLIPVQQSQLNQTYGKLEKYIVKLTKAEAAYHTAFLNTDLSKVLESISLVLKDLDYIAGKLEGMSDDEFDRLLVTRPQTASYEYIKNPHKQYWGMFGKSIRRWIQNHISEIIVGLIIAALVAWFGFNR